MSDDLRSPPSEESSTGRLPPEEWERFHRSHASRILALLIGVLKDRDLAAEAAQNTFLKAWNQIHSVAEERRAAWLSRVAINEAWLLRRQRRTEVQHLMHAVQRQSAARLDSPGVDEGLLTREMQQRIRAAIERLPEEQRAVVLLRMQEDQTFAIIAERLGVPLGTVLTRMRLALRKLRETLSESEPPA